MISTVDFRGKAKYQTTVAGMITLWINSERVQQIKNTSASAATVDLTQLAWLRADQLGGPRFYIVNDPTSTGSIDVFFKHAITNVNTTLTIAPGEVAVCHAVTTTAWFLVKRVIGTPRALGHPTLAAITNETTPRTYSPYCLEGEGCELMEALDGVPLDGQDGRDQCIAPMFMNSALALNSLREPIRGADLVMPSVVPIKFSQDDFMIDSAHPTYATTPLSNQFLEALYAGDRWHGLIYLGTRHGISSHWHHIRLIGTTDTLPLDWDMPNNYSVRRHVWQKLITYRDASDTERTITIRFVMEHTVDPEPILHGGGGGGINDDEFMAWGALFNIYVFTNEILPAFADGNTYAPVGSGGSPIAFSLDDPVRWGGIVGEGQDDKFCHPQMAICASLPTTFEAPAGSFYVPWQDRKWLKSFLGGYTLRGKNREACYVVSNGAPWMTGSCADEALGGVGKELNIVFGGVFEFGVSATSYNYAAMTTGGDVPRSKPTEYVCIENGAGIGRTLLKPLRPGWDEDCGKLTPGDGSSISVRICVDDKYGIDDGTGRRVWPRDEADLCMGNIDEPLDEIGGTHYCFNNNGIDCNTMCCISLKQQIAGVYDKCVLHSFPLGDRLGSGDCDLLGDICSDAGTFWHQVVMELEDYDYSRRANPDIRTASWRRDLPDPDQVLYDVTYAAADTDWVDEIGTWTHGATLKVNAPGVSRSLCLYEASGYTNKYRDMIINARGLKCRTAVHGLAVRMDETAFTGYVAKIVRVPLTNGATVYIQKSTGIGYVDLASKVIANLTHEIVDMSLEVWGTTITFTWQVTGHDEDSLTVENCAITDRGWPGVFDPTADANVEFDNLNVDDTTQEYVTATGYITKSEINLDYPEKMRTAYRHCDETIGSITNCNTTVLEYHREFATAATWSHCRDVIYIQCDPDGSGTAIIAGDNPTSYDGPPPYCCDTNWCTGDADSCSQCPAPFMSMYFNFWQQCNSEFSKSVSSNHIPKICSGIALYNFTTIVCA